MLFFQAILGAILGSFLFASHSRKQTGGNIYRPARSYCDQCAETIAWYDLVPIISYLALRGRCRWCGFKIPRASLYCEIFFGCLLLCWQPTFLRTGYVIIGGLLFFMAVSDACHFNYPATYGYWLMLCTATVYTLFRPHHFIFIFIFICWLILQFYEPKLVWLGSGDLDIFLCLVVLLGLTPFAWLLLLSSFLALIAGQLLKQRRLPFIPFIAMGYLVVLFFI